MALTYLVKKAKRNPKIGLCGSLLHYYYEPERVQAINGVYNKYFATSQYNTSILSLKPIDYVVGASMLISKEFIEDIGLLSEEYFLYYEELDWVMRAKGKYIQAYATESIVYHKEGATIEGKAIL